MHLNIQLATLVIMLCGISSANALIGKPDPGHGGFVGIQGSATTADKDKLIESTGTAFKIFFGPNITEKLSLEFGLMDMGDVILTQPNAVYDEENPDDPPSFENSQNGEVDTENASGDNLASATYTGSTSYRPQSALVTFRYRFKLKESIDLFLKAGANIWKADVKQIEIIALSDQTVTKRELGIRKRSAVSGISGAGILWKPFEKVSIRAEVEYSTLESEYVERTTFINYGLGAQYEF